MIDVSRERRQRDLGAEGQRSTVESKAGATQVTAGSTLTVRGENDAELSPISAPDEWEQWNVDRDRQVLAWNESSRYLPRSCMNIRPTSTRTGNWDYTPDYGYVWVPTAVGADWAPYSYGSWLWIRGSYVWVDYDPWGWAPSHYGRWVFAGSRWCWVPPAVGVRLLGAGLCGLGGDFQLMLPGCRSRPVRSITGTATTAREA